jgi:hypothetical protein
MRRPGVDLVLSNYHAAVSKEDVPKLSLLLYSREIARLEVHEVHGGWANLIVSTNASVWTVTEQDTDIGPPVKPIPSVLLTLLPPPSQPIRY